METLINIFIGFLTIMMVSIAIGGTLGLISITWKEALKESEDDKKAAIMLMSVRAVLLIGFIFICWLVGSLL